MREVTRYRVGPPAGTTLRLGRKARRAAAGTRAKPSHRLEPRWRLERVLRERSCLGRDTDMAGERALQREVGARRRGGLERVHTVECSTADGGGLAVTCLRLGDARGDAVEMPYRDAGAVRTLREREHLGGQLPPLGTAGRSGARLLPGT
jgi:hypothetical protein